MKQVKVTAQPALLANGKVNPNAGKIFTQTLNADGTPKLDKNDKPYGTIRVIREDLSLGFTLDSAKKVRSALKTLTVNVYNGVKDMLKADMLIDNHNIVWKDSLVPFFPNQRPLQVPARDENNKVIPDQFNIITSGGAPVFRNVVLTEDMSMEDELLTYDKTGIPVVNEEKKKVTDAIVA